MLRLAGGQVEALFNELLPVEVRELPEDLAHPYLPRPTTGPLATMKISDLRLEYQPQHFMVAPCLRSGPANGGGIP